MRYSPGFQRQLEYAAYDCAQRGAAAVEIDHLLMGLYREDFPLIDEVLASFSVDAMVVLDRLLERHPEGARPKRAADEVQLGEEALRAIALAEREADEFGHALVAPAHTLLGILRCNRDRLDRYFIREAIFKDREDHVLDRVRELVARFRFTPGASENQEYERLDDDTVVGLESLPRFPAPGNGKGKGALAARLRLLKRLG